MTKQFEHSTINDAILISKDVIKRFYSLIDVSKDQCWLWKGIKDHKNYGLIFCKGRNELAHRVSWIINNGEIPEELCVLHKCNNSSCVNPNHLYLGTHKDNMNDRIGTFKYLKRWGNKGSIKNVELKITQYIVQN